MDAKELYHIAKIIEKEVGFFNGWSVDEGAVEAACLKSADKIDKYLKRRAKRALEWRNRK